MVTGTDDSILDKTKKALGLAADYTAFDSEIILHINSVFSTLTQLGVGPIDGFEIEDNTTQWIDFTGGDKKLNLVKTYMYLRVRMLFDPPSIGSVIIHIEKEIEQLEWRLNVTVDNVIPVDTTTITDYWLDPDPTIT
jgi:hypothetical protein